MEGSLWHLVPGEKVAIEMSVHLLPRKAGRMGIIALVGHGIRTFVGKARIQYAAVADPHTSATCLTRHEAIVGHYVHI
jgi:hypothetical protein